VASPDFRNYIDLTIYDVEPEDIYANAVEYARTALPEFSPRVGTVEDALLQAVSYSTALTVAAINRLPDGLMEGIAKLLNFNRNEATFATGTVSMENYLIDEDILVPTGTVFEYNLTSNGDVVSYLFETTADVIIPAQSTTLDAIPISAISAGLYPALLDGQQLSIVTPIVGLENIYLVGNLYRGTDSETDVEYLNRAASYFASLSSCLVTASQLTNHIRLNYPDMPNFKVWDLTQFSVDTSYSGSPVAGSVSIAGCDSAGNAIDSSYSSAMLEAIALKSTAGLHFEYQNLTVEELPFSIFFWTKRGYTEALVATAMTTKINTYFSLSNFKYRNITANEIIAVASSVEGVAYVEAVDTSPYMGSAFTNDGFGNLTYNDKTYAIYSNVSCNSQGVIDFG
jgi:hypothetical protein